jgi:tetratricopeptide (TPR) repeat protein
MANQPQIALYNQVHGSDEGFVAAFVARLDVLETLVGSLSVIVETGTTNHHMLVGPRGMGKSSLLRRLGIAISNSEILSAHFMPLRFREEQYNVTSLAAFWGNCGEALADWAEQNGLPDLAHELDAAIVSSAWKDAATAERQFRDACQKAGNRRPVLLVDNLDLIVDGIKESEQWALRGALQSESGPILIGAATRFLSQAADRKEAFYEFFHHIVLEPLSEAELLACLRALAGARPQTSGPVLTILNQEPERLRTLYTLTGGNPRVLALIYLLLERAETETIFQDLEVLLDEVTPYYKSRIEEYQTAQQRAVIDAIALHWDPILSRTIAEATGIAPTTISGLLIKLRREGFIQEVQTSSALTGYQISERFLNIWYLMRHGTRRTKARLKWLTIFLARLYSASELANMALQARGGDEVCAWHPHFKEAVLEAEAFQRGQIGKGFEWSAYHEIGVMELWSRANELDRLGKREEEILVYEELVSRLGASTELALREGVAMALYNKGIALGQLNRSEEAILVYEQLVSHFAASTEVALQEQVAMALVNKGIALGELNRSEDEILVYEALVSRFGASPELALQEPVAMALFNKSITLGQLNRSEEKILVCDELVSRFGASTKLALQEIVAMALVNKGVTMVLLNRSEDAILVYKELASRFGASAELTLQESVARALVNMGVTLSRLNRSEGAILAYDELLSRFGASTELALQKQVAMALVNKGSTLGQLNRSEEKMLVYDELVSRFGASTELALQEPVAMALSGKAGTLIDIVGDLPAASLLLQQAMKRDANNSAVTGNLAWIYIFQGKAETALQLLDKLQALPALGINLLKAGIEIARDNLGNGLTHLQAALKEGFEGDTYDFFGDLLWFLRLCEARGYGLRILDWLSETEFADRYAPLTIAFNAYVKGERFLLDSNPEVRGAARTLYDRMDRHRQHKAKLAMKEKGSVRSSPKSRRK